jgi:uncharacterized LabA/DUF88 family protein
MPDNILIVDEDQRYRETFQGGRKRDPDREAQALSMLVKAFGRENRCIALVSQDDDRGLSAYRNARFETIAVNGNRTAEIDRLIGQMSDVLRTAPPPHMVIVTADPAFEALCACAARNPHTRLSVWIPGSEVPQELAWPKYHVRQLEELLQTPKVLRLDVRLDYENLHIGVKQITGRSPDPKQVIRAVRDAIKDKGEVVRIVAYADWGTLSKGSDKDIQRELALISVETCYLVNMCGKNSADMKIADDIRTLVEKSESDPDAVDGIVLGTGDRDFRSTVETAKARGKQVIVLSLREALSRELQRVAGEVRYLDDYLHLSTSTRQLPTGAVAPSNELAALIMRIEVWLRRRRWRWADKDKLLAAVASTPSEIANLHRAIEAGVIAQQPRSVATANGRPRRAEVLMLDPGHPLVQTIRRLVEWTPTHIAYCLRDKGMPWVDSNFLAKGMAMDATFRRLGVGQTRADAEEWLELAAAHGVIVKKRRPHPGTPGRIIDTWWLPGEAGESPTNDYPQS